MLGYLKEVAAANVTGGVAVTGKLREMKETEIEQERLKHAIAKSQAALAWKPVCDLNTDLMSGLIMKTFLLPLLSEPSLVTQQLTTAYICMSKCPGKRPIPDCGRVPVQAKPD
jgi:hypothetical protein